jgi:CspA family cold shock protein
MEGALLDGHPLAPVEMVGRVKWFDLTKGYGFIIPDSGGPDVILYTTVLRRDGFKAIHDGARVVAEVMHRDRGPQVYRVLAVEAGEAARPSQLAPAHRQTRVAAIGRFEIVTMKWFNHVRGFGFLSRGEGAEDIFVHAEMLRRNGLLRVKPGVSLLARFGPGPRGLVATEVRPLKVSRLISSH